MFRTLPVIADLFSSMDRNFSESAVQSSTVTTTNAFASCDFTRYQNHSYQNHSETGPLASSPKPVERITPKSVGTESNNDVSVSDSLKSCDSLSLSDVKVELVNAELWKKFHTVGNEMKVTKPGRRMFPGADLNLTGLLPNDVYKVAIAFEFVDEFRYRFSRSRGTWSPSMKVDRVEEPSPKHRRCCEHPSSPTNGRRWTSIPLVFDKIAITNHLETAESANLVCLPTLRKYHIQLIVTKLHCAQCQGSHTRQIDIPLTDFIAVTGYYNMKVTQLKIDSNPAARYLRQKEKNIGLGRPESEQPEKQKNRKRKREEKDVSRAPVTVISPIKSSHCEISPSTLSRFSSTPPSETSSATLSCFSSTSPSETSSATLSCLSPISPSETSSATPYCYIDFTSTTYPPPLHHATIHACESAEQFTAGSQIDYYIPGCPLTHLSTSTFPSPCATPETYVEGPAMSNVEVNTLVPYNYMYNFDSYYNSLYGNYLSRNNFHSLDYSSANYDNYFGSNYDN